MWSVSFRETGGFADIPHLFHFLELLMVFFAKHPDPDKVSHITFPQWPGGTWKGKNGYTYNEWILERMYPGVVFQERTEDGDMAVIDRGKLNHGSINKSWCKYIRHFDPYLWARTLKIPRNPVALPVVTYVSRQGAKVRNLAPHIHEKFVKEMLEIPDIEFVNARMEDIPFEEQFALANKTDLLVGVHGNGLSHAAFMRPHRNVIEIFTPGTNFHWDYYTLSKMMGHEYACIFNDHMAVPQIFVKNKQVVCNQLTRIPTEFIEMVAEQIREEK